MGQADIVAWLAKNPGWHRTTVIAEALGRGVKGVNQNLRIACSWGDIQSRRAKHGLAKEWRAL